VHWYASEPTQKTKPSIGPCPPALALALALALHLIPVQTNDMSKDEAEIVLNSTGWHKLDIPSPDQAKFAITGYESQVITLLLNTGDSVVAEPASVLFRTNQTSQTTLCAGCCQRCCSGEDCCVLNLVARTDRQYVALTPNFPTSKVVPVDLSSPDVGGTLVCQRGAFMASCGDVQVGISLDWNFVRCCCGGLGLVRQKLEGSGTAFLAATGTMVQKILQPGEVIIVDSNCVMAFAGSCRLDLRRAGGIMGMLGGGEGIFNTTLTGPG
jgi:uncharacterized protein (AIM24 family)